MGEPCPDRMIRRGSPASTASRGRCCGGNGEATFFSLGLSMLWTKRRFGGIVRKDCGWAEGREDGKKALLGDKILRPKLPIFPISRFFKSNLISQWLRWNSDSRVGGHVGRTEWRVHRTEGAGWGRVWGKSCVKLHPENLWPEILDRPGSPYNFPHPSRLLLKGGGGADDFPGGGGGVLLEWGRLE